MELIIIVLFLLLLLLFVNKKEGYDPAKYNTSSYLNVPTFEPGWVTDPNNWAYYNANRYRYGYTPPFFPYALFPYTYFPYY